MKCSTVTWASQICAPMILPKRFETKKVWACYSCSTETMSPGLSYFSLRIEPGFFPFVLQAQCWSPPNMHDEHRCTLSLSYRKMGTIPSCARQTIYVWCRYNNLS